MKRITFYKVLAALLGISFVGMGVAFINNARLGNDPIGLVYDGIRNITGMDTNELGMVSNLVNGCVGILLFFLARRYINIGTFIYVLPYGTFVTLGTFLYGQIFTVELLQLRILSSVVGCLLLYLGVAICITIDIGVDPLNGIILFLKDVSKKEYRIVKIAFDIVMVLLGTLLGGTYGVVTFVTAITAGPIIQFFCRLLTRSRWFTRGNRIEE